MTEKEAINALYMAVSYNGCGKYTREELSIAIEMACIALHKEMPQKPIGTYTDYKCPVCGRRVRSGKGSSCHQRDNFCQRCGQKLDWED